ncbi:hypothetical protein Q1695_009144 [Nippostrongylus brasiliensis]|nr:hypothetical protein Q1695_009144 [Nippostrongylus brasiliensis]
MNQNPRRSARYRHAPSLGSNTDVFLMRKVIRVPGAVEELLFFSTEWMPQTRPPVAPRLVRCLKFTLTRIDGVDYRLYYSDPITYCSVDTLSDKLY